MRDIKRIKTEEGKSSSAWTKFKPLHKVIINYFLSRISNKFPAGANQIFFKWMGVKIGKNVQIMPAPGFDIFFPELIEVGDGSIIGMECLVLCHEFTTNEFKYGGVKIGKNVLIGARAIILPGVSIGDGALISAGTVVYENVPSNVFAFGSPLQFKGLGEKSVQKKNKK